ncbi:hypothetical protein AB870_03055 [Pandoraea faecigallinarum]|uniref:Diguanylate cyclase n=1 Tax=Pandoraea faecigallinarum TaxID=656179 RepID=A0A173GZY5_9BURK|nr:hypothetical protein [Pandoraea faecigallinarum]ANI21756.1 hypothetical protein AB870_03055 [Pandoraea faecigallinarum]
MHAPTFLSELQPLPAMALPSPRAVGNVADFVDMYIRYGTIPVWLLAGFADWMCHRRTRIEANAGAKESVMHIAQMLEVGIPLMVALVFQVNMTVILIMLAGLVLHEVTALWDVSYARHLRDISALEQHIHSFLELLPICAVTLIVGANLAQIRDAIVGNAPQSFALTLSHVPLPYTAAVVVAAALFAGVPYAEELIRCLRYRRNPRRNTAADPVANRADPRTRLDDNWAGGTSDER